MGAAFHNAVRTMANKKQQTLIADLLCFFFFIYTVGADRLPAEKMCMIPYSQTVGSTQHLVRFMFLRANVAHLGKNCSPAPTQTSLDATCVSSEPLNLVSESVQPSEKLALLRLAGRVSEGGLRVETGRPADRAGGRFRSRMSRAFPCDQSSRQSSGRYASMPYNILVTVAKTAEVSLRL